ncbi:hypothetical protein [Curtobacterium sp. MCBA15_012]|uniref:hypothetical protein n=1 Tax=Curtobacterium sp. MCBA15_012 TaxID=1898738 RepID=UPI0015879B19|nr:hypothetical protein [Curtobacterium sp. MCBA15_012]WIA99237.1 hypothetical protein QOL15_11995 [Curtobacterium sp. MCBA15_012]
MTDTVPTRQPHERPHGPRTGTVHHLAQARVRSLASRPAGPFRVVPTHPVFPHQ